jgi:hypothetical protein
MKEESDEIIEDETVDNGEFYRKIFHSSLLCDDRSCDICHTKPTCHYEHDYYNTAGISIKKLICYCSTTACSKLTSFPI